jgi:hypothetical protein
MQFPEPKTSPKKHPTKHSSVTEAAKGGVLFIDEAYELGKGAFGAEACTSIVAAMTDPKYRGGTHPRAIRNHFAFTLGNTATHYNSVLFQCRA